MELIRNRPFCSLMDGLHGKTHCQGKLCRILFFLCLLIDMKSSRLYGADGFTCKTSPIRNNGHVFTKAHSRFALYLHPASSSSQVQGMAGKKMSTDNKKRQPITQQPRGFSSSLNVAVNAVPSMTAVASSDVLPSFRAAHGLLHPHTFMKLREQYELHGGGDAIRQFLDTYLESGPMACIPCLSDPDILPQLTEAMRSIDP